MKKEKIINKITEILQNYPSADSKKELENLLFELKNDYMQHDTNAVSADIAFCKIAKKIYKANNYKPILKYACLCDNFMGEPYTVMTDSYFLIAKKGNTKIDGLMYCDDYLKDQTYPDLNQVCRCLPTEPLNFDRKKIINELTKLLKLKENKGLITKIHTKDDKYIYLSAKYLLDALSVIETDHLCYHVDNTLKPITLMNDNYFILISPIRFSADSNEFKLYEL